MYRTVLVPLDGSSLSERAVAYGEMLAHAADAHLVLLRVIPPPEFLDSANLAARDKAMSDATEYLSQFVVQAAGEPAIDTLAYSGEPTSIIVEEARARPLSVIVLSTHGRNGVSELVSGSVARDVLRHSQSAVMFIPPNCTGSWSSEHPGRVLVTLDGSKASEAILPNALDVAQALRVEMILMRVVAVTSYIRVEGYPDPVGVPTEGISATEAGTYLDEVADEVRQEGQKVTTLVPEGLDPASAILLAAQDQEAALIAIATHGRSGLPEVILGSVASSVIKQATVPVLLIRPSLVGN